MLPDSISRLCEFFNKDPSNETLARDIIVKLVSQKMVDELISFQADLSYPLSQSDSINIELAKAFIACGDFHRAITVTDLFSESSINEKRYFLALSYFFLGEFERAKNALALSMNQSSSGPTPDAFLLLNARLDYFLGDLESAQMQLEALVQEDTTFNEESAGLLAMVYVDLQKHDKALPIASNVLTHMPNQHDALLALASSKVFYMEKTEALEAAMLGTQCYKESGRFWFVLAQSLMIGKEFDSAYNAIIKASDLMHDHIGTWHVKGWLELLSNNLNLAEQSFSNALEINPNFADSHAALAIILANNGRLEDASRKSKIALRLDPSSITAKYAKGIVDSTSKHVEPEALRALVESILSNPSHIGNKTYLELTRESYGKM